MNSLSFGNARKLKSKSDFSSVFNNAKRIVKPNLMVLFKNNDQKVARLGFALSKKYISKAVERNRIKRIIRESFRHEQLKALDIVFLTRKGLSGINKEQLREQLKQTWQELNLVG